MDPPVSTTEPPHTPEHADSRRDRARRRVEAARARYQGSFIAEIVTQLKALDFASWTTVFGAELLWSALPFIILLSSLANERIDDDLSRHLGLNGQGASIIRTLFRHAPAHSPEPIVTGLIFALVGILFVVSSLQVIYERLLDQDHRGWRDLPRFVAWVGVLLGFLIAEGAIGEPVRRTAGPVLHALLGFVVVTGFFWWTMHFLLAGRVRWRLLIRPALATAVLWLVLAVFSSIYFSSVVIDDSKLYGTIGVVFTLLTWFILIGGVIVLGAAVGAVWQKRAGPRTTRADPRGEPATISAATGEVPVGERG